MELQFWQGLSLSLEILKMLQSRRFALYGFRLFYLKLIRNIFSHCTVRHPLAQQAQNELRMAYPIILALLSTGRPPIVKASLGLVRNCSLTNENLRLILTVNLCKLAKLQK
jgi:hypothetical protein